MHALEVAALAFWLYALVTTILNLLLERPLHPSDRTSGPFVSVIIPARNEERSIGDTVAAMLAQTYRDIELIVIDDQSTDRTPQILASFNDSRLTVIQGEETPAGWLGKPWALEQGSGRARGQLLLFVDADIHYEPKAIASMVDALEASRASMLAVLPHIEMCTLGEQISMMMLPFIVWAGIPFWLGNRWNAVGLALGGGVGNFVRRGDYDAIGGHESLHNAVVDDIGLARQFRARGFRTTHVITDDLVSARIYHGLREVVFGFEKNMFAVLGSVWAACVMAVLMIGVHLMPFALALLGRPISIAIVAICTLIRLMIAIRGRYSLLNAIFLHVPMVLVWFYILIQSTWMTVRRREIHWRGRRSAEWSRFGR
ncbi:MAG TPA: glycosyltransferase family 2 protein [Thermoanaerobaculia bacterium]|jgi:chlorobactene glucosyltransferase